MKTTPRTVAAPLLALALSLLGAAPSPARDADPPPYTELIEVRVVNVEVVVEDRKGERVRGLGPERFRLLVDGVERPLEHFAEIRKGNAVAPAAPRSPEPSAVDSRTAQAPVAPAPHPARPPAVIAGERVANSYLIFVDDYFSIGTHRNFALDRIARQLGRIEAPDQAAIVAFGGRDLELLSGWTSSRVDLDRALTAAAARPAYGLMRFSERDRLGIPQFADSFGGYFPALNEYELRREASALIGAMQSFADAPGRKVLIVLSGGWPSIDTSSYSRQSYRGPGGIQENDLDILRPVTQTANLLGYTLYPVDLPGYREAPTRNPRLAGGFDTSWRDTAGQQATDPNVNLPANAVPETFDFGQRNDSFFGERGFNTPDTDVHREMLRQSTLRVVARDTGGRALLGSARNQALERVVDDTSSYYWLSFTPVTSGDGERHEIEVEIIGGEGYRIRSRRGYRDLTAEHRVELVTLGAAMVRSDTPRNELNLSLGATRRAGYRKIEIPVRVEVPLDKIQFLPGDEGYVANLELRLAAIDSLDRHTEMPIVPVRLGRERLPARHEIASFETVVTMPRRAQRLTVSLFDPVGGKVLLATAELTP